MAHWNTMRLALAVALGALLAAPAARAECPAASDQVASSPFFSASGTCKNISVSGTTVSAECTIYSLVLENVNAAGDNLYGSIHETCNSTSIDLDDHIEAKDGDLSWGGSDFAENCDDVEVALSGDSLTVTADCHSAAAAEARAEGTLKNRAGGGAVAGGVLVAIPSSTSTTPSVSPN